MRSESKTYYHFCWFVKKEASRHITITKPSERTRAGQGLNQHTRELDNCINARELEVVCGHTNSLPDWFWGSKGFATSWASVHGRNNNIISWKISEIFYRTIVCCIFEVGYAETVRVTLQWSAQRSHVLESRVTPTSENVMSIYYRIWTTIKFHFAYLLFISKYGGAFNKCNTKQFLCNNNPHIACSWNVWCTSWDSILSVSTWLPTTYTFDHYAFVYNGLN